jgi:glycosyltransferase involved in cell wall biosynthesis
LSPSPLNAAPATVESPDPAPAATPGTDGRPAVAVGAPPRWDGHVVVGDLAIAWFYGDLPAQWLSARGLHLDVCKIGECYELWDGRMCFGVRPAVTRGAPLLFDSVSSGLVAPVGPRASRRQGRRLLISVDDDLWHLPPWHRQWDDPADLTQFESWLREADGVIVPSARMAERVQPFAREVVVIPPTLPPREAWPGRRRPRRALGLRIGWVGSAAHRHDLERIGPAVGEFLARWPTVTFVLGGQCVPSWATAYPRVEVHSGWWLLPAYYRFIASLDLDGFVCPLLDVPFNTAKPCLKPLEAAMLGLPVIASRVGAYAEELTHEETALLVENTSDDWLAALTRWVEDAALRAHLSARGVAWAATRTIESTGPLWARVWGAPAPAADQVGAPRPA